MSRFLEDPSTMKTAVSAIAITALTMTTAGCARPTAEPEAAAPPAAVAASKVGTVIQPDPREVHLGELKMLTDGGENAEAYFSFAGDRLIFQSTREPHACDQIFTMKLDGSDQRLVSAGAGRTTCAYYLPGDEWVLYASTHGGGPDCPPTPDHSRGYVWPIYADYDIYRARPDGSEVSKLTDTPGYDAEATVSPAGDRIVFTSMRDGDLDIYSMALDGSDVVRLTDQTGYDGGPFFSPDGEKIVYRARHPEDPQEIEDYRSLLADGLIRPSKLEIWVMDADGGNKRRITDLGVAAFAPFFHPSGDKIVFSSNHGDPSGREFELFMVGLDGGNLEQITFSGGFDGFPMFAPDGRTFVFCSNRSNSREGETNVFVTTWQD
jgi:Tol biopolymer transport system component